MKRTAKTLEDCRDYLTDLETYAHGIPSGRENDEVNSLGHMMELSSQLVPLEEAITKAKGSK